MKLQTNLTIGFALVVLMVFMAGTTGFITNRRIIKSTDTIIDEKFPVNDASMEASVSLISTRDAAGELMLNEDGLDAIENEIREDIGDFNMWISMARYGTESREFTTSDAGEMYRKDNVDIVIPAVTPEVQQLAADADSKHEVFSDAAEALIKSRQDELAFYSQMEQQMEIFDSSYEAINEALVNYEDSRTSWNDKDSAMEARIILGRQKAIGEEYAGIAQSSPEQQADLRKEFEDLTPRYQAEAVRFPASVKESYQSFVEAATTMLDDKDESLARRDQTYHDMATLDSASQDVESVLSELETQVGDEIATAQAQADRVRIIGNITLVAAVILGLLMSIAIGIIIIRSVLRQLGSEPAEIAEIAELVSKGDLNYDYGDKEAVGVYASMKTMTENLTQIISNVLNASEMVDSGSGQLSSSAQQLSAGTSEQASSLEEVSSSMEELVSNIEQNTDNARSSEEIANRASESAATGGEAVNVTVDAMKSIAERIGIIEDIARNTNMLALNAAIEAARAGDAGKGFAVVASEVRKLAENSQKAAGEITEIASNSVEKAEKAGEIINRLVPDIRKTAELVQEITSASMEQSRGADQINTALTQLNQIIQQNASAAEEMAGMSEELAGQATQLKSTMSYFSSEGKNADSVLMLDHGGNSGTGEKARQTHQQITKTLHHQEEKPKAEPVIHAAKKQKDGDMPDHQFEEF